MAFTLVTAVTSVVPGPNMMFVMTQAVWRGSASGLAAMAGLELGNLAWFIMAAFGLGVMLKTVPLAFALLSLVGALYLAWMGFEALRGAIRGHSGEARAVSRPAAHAFRDGIAVALGNPKSLVYVSAILPPFVDMRRPAAPQVVSLAIVALSIDVVVSLAYIYAGTRLNVAISRPEVRRWLDLGVGLAYLGIAAAVLWWAMPGLRSALVGP
ncbi:MAG: LysE family translocator [Novosphingobium sp.]